MRAAVLASTGKVFSAGGDFDFMLALRADTGQRIRSLDEGRLLLNTLIDVPFPVVTALHGDAIGLGATVVLATDAVVAARSAGLSDTHVNIGLVAGDGGCVLWPAAAGILRAKRYPLTGDRLPAEEARLGPCLDPGCCADAPLVPQPFLDTPRLSCQILVMADTMVVEMNEQGRVVIPAGVRKQLGLRPGVRLVLRVDQGGLVLVPEDAIKQKLWAMFEGVPFSMSEQLIQERAHEAQLQNKQ